MNHSSVKSQTVMVNNIANHSNVKYCYHTPKTVTVNNIASHNNLTNIFYLPSLQSVNYEQSLTLQLYCSCLYCFSFFVIVCSRLEWKRILPIFYRLFIYIYPLEIQLSRWDNWDFINRFNPATFVYL
jgi:hypothetical protein